MNATRDALAGLVSALREAGEWTPEHRAELKRVDDLLFNAVEDLA